MVAGIKVGGIAALGCAIAGYTGGKFFKNMNDQEAAEKEPETVPKAETDGCVQKKEI